MRIKDCEIVDNFAQTVTHGVTMIASEVFVEGTQIQNTEPFYKYILDKKLEKVDTGFFNLYLSSELHISKNTEIRSLIGTKQAVLYAGSQSSVFTAAGVTIINCEATAGGGVTMYFENTKDVVISESNFISNDQANVKILSSKVGFINSTFTDGKENHIQAIDSDISLDSVTIENSIDNESEGHGVKCMYCSGVNIINSNFRNLTALQTPAIMIQYARGDQINILGSSFERNHAQERIGAIRLSEN